MPAATYNPKTTHHLNVDRLLGVIGGVTVLVATGLPWYVQHVSVHVAGFGDRYSTGLTLWDVRKTASWLLVVAVGIGLIAVLSPILRERTAGLVACAAGFAVIVYGLVALFVIPIPGLGRSRAPSGRPASTLPSRRSVRRDRRRLPDDLRRRRRRERCSDGGQRTFGNRDERLTRPTQQLSEVRVDELDGHRAFAHGGGAAFR